MARDRCAAYNPDGTAYYLARIDDSTENGQIAAFTTAGGGDDAWIGGHDIGMEQQWRWLFGNTLFCSNTPPANGCTGPPSPAPYRNFAGGEPNNGCNTCPDQHCAVIRTNGLWDDEYCGADGTATCVGAFCGTSAVQRFVCEGRTRCGNGVVQSGEACDDGNPNNNDGCSSTCAVEPGYGCTGAPSNCVQVCSIAGGAISNFAGRRYEFCNVGNADWAHADAYCRQRGQGRLARIDNALEQQHVQAQLGALDTWIDGVRPGGPGTLWEWADNGDDFFSAAGVSQRYT